MTKYADQVEHSARRTLMQAISDRLTGWNAEDPNADVYDEMQAQMRRVEEFLGFEPDTFEAGV